MRNAHKVGSGLSLIHGVLIFTALWSGFDILLFICAASIYLPLTAFAHLGLPVFEAGSGWGWSEPTALGYVLALVFWPGIWFLVGYMMEVVLKRSGNIG